MNLRILLPTKLERSRPMYMSLFHLRMHDLRKRDISFRRYCRDSGREVCHTSFRFIKVAQRKSRSRTIIRRSSSNPFKSRYTSSRYNDSESLQINQSRGSMSSIKSWIGRRNSRSSRTSNASESDNNWDPEDETVDVAGDQVAENKKILEFSNYAHVEVTRRGYRSKKRHMIEYWDDSFTWKRKMDKRGKDVADCRWHSFQLHRREQKEPIAYIEPEVNDGITKKEAESGGWVPPCAMRILDEKSFNTLSDICDVIVATGVVVLVDNAIRSRFKQASVVKPSKLKATISNAFQERILKGDFYMD
ncbi:hypothetical protein K469DRAFT_166355 [Zopfia rhizophila CBS 207.26]|uniref:Uncharacterized protein n=1 Tax=Zopfia rhizophila CBS 207.26 TaxID=1314779 RepID=A0A6A6E405_9PEZI|nr:hypothetical protein K469DRAFT_166355 [Zopfia rhizophila CBS 207.26]